MGMSTKEVIGLLAVIGGLIAVVAFATGNLSVFDSGDDGEEDLTDIRDATPELIFHFQEDASGDLYVAEEEMENQGNYVEFNGSDVDTKRSTSFTDADTVGLSGWADSGEHYAAVEADGYHTAFWTFNVDSEVPESKEDEYRLYGFYDGEAQLEEEAVYQSNSAALYDADDDQVGFESSSDSVEVSADTDRVEANFEVDSGVAYLGEVDITASEEMTVSVIVDGSAEIDEETYSEGDTVELADNMEEDPLTAEEDIQIVFDDLGGSTTDEAVTVNDIYGDEAVSTNLTAPA